MSLFTNRSPDRDVRDWRTGLQHFQTVTAQEVMPSACREPTRRGQALGTARPDAAACSEARRGKCMHPDLEKPVLCPRGQGAGAMVRPRTNNVVTADLDTSETLAERLRIRSDGDTGPQERTFLRSR